MSVIKLLEDYIDKGMTLPHEVHEHNSWYQMIKDWTFLSPFLQDPEITEVIINKPGFLFYEKNNKLERQKITLTKEDINLAIRILCHHKNKDFNPQTPFISFDHTQEDIPLRISILHSSLGHQQFPLISFRKMSYKISKLPQQLTSLISSKDNILILGDTSSGKTTLLNSFCENAPIYEHWILIHDIEEGFPNKPNLSLLKGDPFTLLPYALRLRPDRILINEIRSQEVLSYLHALLSGHRGSITTLHALDPLSAINRLALLFQYYGNYKGELSELKKIISSVIDKVIVMKNKSISKIYKIINYNENGLNYVVL